MEVIVYSGLALLALGLISAIFIQSRRHYDVTSSSYLVGRDAEAAIRRLRTELQESALTSLRAYPHPNESSEAPGLALLSARDPKKGFIITPHGAPKWSQQVFYTVDDGSLRRWQQEWSNPSPIPAGPSALPSAKITKTRVILRGLAEPGQELPGIGKLDTHGGFRALFVRQDDKGEVASTRAGESLTAWNPAAVTRGKAKGLKNKGNTRQLEVTLIVRSKSSATGKASVARLPFRVTPRH